MCTQAPDFFLSFDLGERLVRLPGRLSAIRVIGRSVAFVLVDPVPAAERPLRLRTKGFLGVAIGVQAHRGKDVAVL